MNKTFLIILITTFFIILLGWTVFVNSENRSWLVGSETASSSIVSTSSTKTVNLYYYRPQNDMNDSGVLQCSEAGLVAAETTVPLGTTIEETLELLLAGGLTIHQRQEGVTTDFPLPDLRLIGIRIDEGVATVALDDPQGTTGGGVCRVNILRGQIQKTLEQFSRIDTVRFLPETLFQP